MAEIPKLYGDGGVHGDGTPQKPALGQVLFDLRHQRAHPRNDRKRRCCRSRHGDHVGKRDQGGAERGIGDDAEDDEGRVGFARAEPLSRPP